MRIIKIGSSSGCDLVLNSTYVSSVHAEITVLDNGELFIEDLGSTNGTFVGNKRINTGVEVPIRRGDYIRFADTELVWARIPAVESNAQYKAIVNIGSNFRNDIVINSSVVGRFHAILKIDKKNKAYIYDNNSKNGTSVNGMKIPSGKPYRITRNDNIVCADTDVTEQLHQFIPSNNGWIKWLSATVAAVVLLAVGLWGLSIIIGSKHPEQARDAVALVLAGYHYEIEFEGLPENIPPIKIKIYSSGIDNFENPGLNEPFINTATAFFVDADGRLVTNRHVAVPWDKDYRPKEINELLIRYMEDVRVQLENEIKDREQYEAFLAYFNGTGLDAYIKLQDDLKSINYLIKRIHDAPIKITGKHDFVRLGYNGRNYTSIEEYELCTVLSESGNKDIDLALLQLNTKKTPSHSDYFDLNSIVIEDPKVNETLRVTGYSGGLNRSLDQVTKSMEPTFVESYCSKEPSRYYFEMNYSDTEGSSGSPVYDKKNRLRGVVFGGYEVFAPRTHAIKAKFIKELYDKEVL